jgi:hypothetical protein
LEETCESCFRQGRLDHRRHPRPGPQPRRSPADDGADIIALDIFADIATNEALAMLADRDEKQRTGPRNGYR